MTDFVAILHTNRTLDISEIRDVLDTIRSIGRVERIMLVRKSENAIVLNGTFSAPKFWQRCSTSYRDLLLKSLRSYRPIPLHALDVLMKGANELDPDVSGLTQQRHHLTSDLHLCGVKF